MIQIVSTRDLYAYILYLKKKILFSYEIMIVV